MAGGQRTKGLNKSCFLLIVIAGIERFAFKGVASNLVTYLTDVVKMSNSAAAKTVNNWCGFTSMLPLLVASLADSCWDKYPTILASSFIYVVVSQSCPIFKTHLAGYWDLLSQQLQWFLQLDYSGVEAEFIFQQPATFFTKQGVTMKRNIGSNFKIPPATLQSSITVSIILLMPLMILFIPIIRIITRDEKGINVMQRMGIGMVLSIIAMMIAALVETKRLEMSQKMPHSETVPLSIFWLLPQYILLGISDIFTVVGMQEFFYSEVPGRMKTMGIALYTSVFGVGSFLGALLISLVEIFNIQEGGRAGSLTT
ncbi:hypothetical protein GH714_011523 [Hevea brasiliensis]|uniref:Major facilitator superfamily (MFS) profile domain-containing protein n=1 Tax=Hevea brasiliensis TaxID=3981 RepID=A0A6A6M9J8_HEVBR|nr:hypothetical protein GH714_011523 [Hevea brasiliensis]